MAAHKKGQAKPGAYTDAKNEHTDSSRYNETSVNGGSQGEQSRETGPVGKRYIAPITDGPGLDDVLPK